MADNKISDLPTTTLTTSDLIEVEQPAETAGTRSRKATLAQAIALALDNDPTLAGDSALKAATQQAVKAFVEDAIAALTPNGASIGVQFLADTSSTSDADPGAGNLRWNHATQGSATVLFLDDNSVDGAALTGFWSALDAGGFVYLQHATDQDIWQIWEVTGITDDSGYAKLTVADIAGSGSFADNDPMLVTLEQGQASGSVTSVNSGTGAVIALQCIAIAFSDETTAITAGTNKAKFINPYSTAFNVVNVAGSLSTAQASGSIFTIDINEAGTSILSTKLTIDNTEKVGGSHASAGSATPAVISDASIAAFAEIGIDVDQVGDGTAKGGKVYLIGYPTI